MLALGWNPDSTEQSVQKHVRISWPLTDNGSPDWERTDDTVFIQFRFMREPFTELEDVSYVYESSTAKLKERVSYHRALDVTFLCYGDNAVELADALRIGLTRPSVREYLLSQDLAPWPHIPMPVRMPEQDDSGVWWNRCDLQVSIYDYAERDTEVNYISTVNPPTLTTQNN